MNPLVHYVVSGAHARPSGEGAFAARHERCRSQSRSRPFSRSCARSWVSCGILEELDRGGVRDQASSSMRTTRACYKRVAAIASQEMLSLALSDGVYSSGGLRPDAIGLGPLEQGHEVLDLFSIGSIRVSFSVSRACKVSPKRTAIPITVHDLFFAIIRSARKRLTRSQIERKNRADADPRVVPLSIHATAHDRSASRGH
jgi:hypothetical protein